MTLELGRNIAVIILAVEYIVLSLIPLAALYGAVKGMRRLLPEVRRWMRLAHSYLVQFGLGVNTLMRWLLAPILFLSGLRAGLQAGTAALRRR